MASNKRPFFRYSIYQLETIVENRQLHEDMSDILYELSFRRTSRAKTLQRKLSNGDYKRQVDKTASPTMTNQSQHNFFNKKKINAEEKSTGDFIPLIIILLIVLFMVFSS